MKGPAQAGYAPRGLSAAEAKCTEAEIAAVTGHRSPSMVAHYTRQANRRHLASAALSKRERGRG